MGNATLQNFMKNMPIFAKLTAQEQILLLENTRRVKFEKGKVIHAGYEDCTGIIIIINGVLKSFILSEEGREITLYRMYDNEICLLSASCVLEAINVDIFVSAEEETEAYIIDAEICKGIMEKNIYLENYALNLVVTRFGMIMDVFKKILFLSFDKRLATFLKEEADKNSNRRINYTHEQIASYVGSSREVVSRKLRQFADEGLVKVTRNSIEILDYQSLSRLVD